MTTVRPLTRSTLPGRTAELAHLLRALPYLLPALLVFAAFTYYPLVRVVYLSLTNSDMLRANPNFVGAANYRALLASSEFWSSLGITATFALGVTALEVGLPPTTGSGRRASCWATSTSRTMTACSTATGRRARA